MVEKGEGGKPPWEVKNKKKDQVREKKKIIKVDRKKDEADLKTYVKGDE